MNRIRTLCLKDIAENGGGASTSFQLVGPSDTKGLTAVVVRGFWSLQKCVYQQRLS